MKRIIFYLIILFSYYNFANAGFFDFLTFPKTQTQNSQIIIATGIQERQHQLSGLKKEKETLESGEKEFNEAIQPEINQTTQQITVIKEKIQESRTKEKDFLSKLLAKLNELSQTLIDTQLLRKKLITILDQHIELLEGYIKDPSFKSISIEPKASYKFEELIDFTKEISNKEDHLVTLNEEKTSVEASVEARKKEISELEREIKLRDKERKEFNKSHGNIDDLTLRQRGEILDLEIRLLNAKKRLLNLKIKETSYKIALINSQIFINELILKNFRQDLIMIENSLLVTESDLEVIDKELANKRRDSLEMQAKYTQDISQLAQRKDILKQEFEKIIKNYNIHVTDLRALDDWGMDFTLVSHEPALYELGYLNSQILNIDREIEFKEAQRDFEKTSLKIKEITADIINSWYKISQRKLKTEEEINRERQKYTDYKSEEEKELINNKDKINVITNLLNSQTRTLNNLKDKIKKLNQRQKQFIESYGNEDFNKSLSFLKKAEEQITLQNDLNNKLIEIHSNLISEIKSSLKYINVILSKLDRIFGILQRSEYAISWVNIKNIIPDIKLFLSDIKYVILSSISKISIKSIIPTNLSNLFKFLINLILLVLLFIFLKKLIPALYSLFLSVKPINSSLAFVNYLIALICGFISANFFAIFIWLLLFIFIKFDLIVNLGFQVIFYLFSIPFLCYLTHKFVKFLIEFNIQHNYVLLSPVFQKRFIRVFLFFSYSTIILLFFREAFLITTYGKSELPSILLALYSIIFRASLIFLIGKEEILSIVPAKDKFWIRVRKLIDSYYYLFLAIIVFVMIVSDPYIGGFSKLVSFILWGIIASALLLIALWWIQILIRRLSTVVFFSTEEDEIKERFPYAKTFYGLFIIATLIIFVFTVIFFGAKIWHHSIPLEKITEVFNLTIFSVPGPEVGQSIPITPNSFVTIFGFLFLGFIIAWAFNRFVLNRIFDLLLVDPGVQNTISRVIYYFIVILILLVGLLRVGFNSLIPFLLGALAVGLAFALKGPANDFIGYFIILLERSLKIGDYIEVDELTKGVVRKITPRSVVLRHKNSVSIIVPNSKLTNTSFYNWGYSNTGFFAFDDILFTIPFICDTQTIISILRKVLNEDINILKKPEPIIRLHDFNENGYVFLVRGFLSSAKILNQWDIASDVRLSIVKNLRDAGIQVASPVRRLIITSEDQLKEFTQSKER